MPLDTAPDVPQTPDAPRLDCETAVLIRSWLRPLVDNATGWAALIDALSGKGYALTYGNGTLWLTEAGTGRRICTMRHLGSGLRDLVSRLGRPALRPIPGRPSSAELRAHR